MATDGIPKGYHSITPALIVRDAPAAIEFYKQAFGATERHRMAGPDGKIMHAEIQIGDSVVMMGEENVEWGMKSPFSTNGLAGSLHIYVEDADKAFEKAIRAGATVKQPLEDAFWGDRYGKVTDPFGHEWGIATNIRDLSPEEMKRAAEEWMAKMGQGAQEAQA